MAPPPQAERPFTRHPALIDLGATTSHAAQFQVRIQAPSPFQLSANLSGKPAAVAGDIDHFRLYLIESVTSPQGELTPAYGPFEIAATLTGAEQVVTFQHLPPAQSAYYVAVQARNSSDQNLTAANTGWRIGQESVALSTQGGDGAGQVTVHADYTVSSTLPLEVALPLRAAEGAQLDIPVTVVDGSSYQAPDIAYFKLYLVDRNLGSPEILAGPFQITAALNNQQQSLGVFHLRPGAYYVALAAYDAQDQNLTDSQLTVDGQATAISNSGGETLAPGKITVATDYSVSSSEPVGVTFNLR